MEIQSDRYQYEDGRNNITIIIQCALWVSMLGYIDCIQRWMTAPPGGWLQYGL